MSAIPEIKANPNGLHQRYCVTKNNGEQTDPLATYFVLRLDAFGRDGVHVAACRAAAKAYAEFVSGTHLERVGSDLSALVDHFDSMGG